MKNNSADFEWSCLAEINRTEFYGNCALVLKTPKYPIKLTDSNKKRIHKVFYRLIKPSSREFSEKCSFFYYSEDSNNKLQTLIGSEALNQSRLFAKRKYQKIDQNQNKKIKIDENKGDSLNSLVEILDQKCLREKIKATLKSK